MADLDPVAPGGVPRARRFRRLPLLLLAASAMLFTSAVTVRLFKGEVRADRRSSHVHPGSRLTWRFKDGSTTVYVVRSVAEDGAVVYERLRFEPGAGDEPSSREERTFRPLSVPAFIAAQYTSQGSTFQARGDRLKVGRAAFDCAVVRVWRKPPAPDSPTPRRAPIYEEWIPADGDHVVFPGCALQGDEPPGTQMFRLTSIE